MAILSLFLSIPLAVFPWSKYRNHLTPVRNFFLRPRTTVIFTCFLTLGWFAAMISMTVHANTSSTCTLDAKLQKSNSGYASAWMKQVSCKHCCIHIFGTVMTNNDDPLLSVTLPRPQLLLVGFRSFFGSPPLLLVSFSFGMKRKSDMRKHLLLLPPPPPLLSRLQHLTIATMTKTLVLSSIWNI